MVAYVIFIKERAHNKGELETPVWETSVVSKYVRLVCVTLFSGLVPWADISAADWHGTALTSHSWCGRDGRRNSPPQDWR